MKRTQVLLVALALLVLAGCQEAPSAVEESPAPALDFTIHTSSPEAFSDTPVLQEALVARAKAAQQAMATFYRIINNASDWRDAHEEVQRELSAPSKIPQYNRAQTAAILMLKTYLLGEDADADKLEAIGYYTNLLIEHKNPEGPLLVEVLQRLQGHWSKKEVAAAASQAMVGPEAFLAKRLKCEDCSTKTLERMSKNTDTDLGTTEDIFLSQTVHALAQLREMSQQ